MDGDQFCAWLARFLEGIPEGTGGPYIEAIRRKLDEYDEYASWGDDR